MNNSYPPSLFTDFGFQFVAHPRDSSKYYYILQVQSVITDKEVSMQDTRQQVNELCKQRITALIDYLQKLLESNS